jgi:TatD DNase family protein
MTANLFDSHAHLTSSDLYQEIDAVLTRAQNARVNGIVNICTDLASLEKGMRLKKKYPWIFHAAGIHPHDVDRHEEALFSTVARHAEEGQIIAIGETGLDYHYPHGKRESQQAFLRRHLLLAAKTQLPLIIHCREAFEDLFKIFDEEMPFDRRRSPGILHCFTGTMTEAQEALQRGFYLSLSGVVTFKKSQELKEIAKMIPLDKLLIETDAPFLAPQSKRGHSNEPAYIKETAEVIAAIKGLSLSELAQATTANAHQIFSI